MPIDLEQSARFEAAHNAYRIVEKNGAEAGTEILRGYFIAYMRAVAAVEGWAAVREMILQHGEKPSVPTHGRKLELVVSNTAEIVKGVA